MLSALHDWAPFKIDALNIVTILGAEEVNRALGRFVASPLTDFLPHLAAFVIASAAISRSIPGFRLYNINDGLVGFDSSPWFARWLQTQDLTWNSTFLYINTLPKSRRQRRARTLVALGIGTSVLRLLFVLCVLTHDWWGFANVTLILISVFVKWFTVKQRTGALAQEIRNVQDEGWARVVKKVLLITPEGKALTLYVPCGLITEVLLEEQKLLQPNFDRMARALGWVGFGCHIITLGMTTLFNQLFAITTLVLTSVLTITRLGTDETQVATFLTIQRLNETKGSATRARIYHRLDLTPTEEDSLVEWGLFPQRSNKDWWAKYRSHVADSDRKDLMVWKNAMGLSTPNQECSSL